MADNLYDYLNTFTLGGLLGSGTPVGDYLRSRFRSSGLPAYMMSGQNYQNFKASGAKSYDEYLKLVSEGKAIPPGGDAVLETAAPAPAGLDLARPKPFAMTPEHKEICRAVERLEVSVGDRADQRHPAMESRVGGDHGLHAGAERRLTKDAPQTDVGLLRARRGDPSKDGQRIFVRVEVADPQ